MILTTLARGDDSRVAERRRVIARTDEEWRALWAIHAGPDASAPALDLGAVVVAAAFAGQKPSAGYSVEITAAAAMAPGAVRPPLVVYEHRPAADSVAAAILTSPFHIVTIERAGGDVTWAPDAGQDTAPTSEVAPAPFAPDVRGPVRQRPRPSGRAQPSSTGLEPRTASMLAYLAGPFSGALILLAESSNSDVRFHAWQSIVGLGGLGLAVVASYVLAVGAIFVSATVVSLMVGVATVIWIVLAMVWALCLWKAWSGKRWKLPLAGDYAERLGS